MAALLKSTRPAEMPQEKEPHPVRAPARPSARSHGLASVLARNIRAVKQRRDRDEAAATREERIAEAITRFTGSMRFVYLHLVLFGSWIAINLVALPGLPQFDPNFMTLAMVASVEAIFLSTFILISQNRMTSTADKHSDLDLQINLLAEHEITKLLALISAVADRMGIETEIDPEAVEELKQDVAPEVVLDEIEGQKR